jgi:hypothetical protein
MLKTTSLTALLGVALAAGANQTVQPAVRTQDILTTKNVENTLTADEKAKGWKLLFDGKTTNGWRGFKQQTPPQGWQVVDGALTRVGTGGDIMTADKYGSFEMQAEWKVAPGGNSGIMFHVSEEADETYYTGPEFQILDNGGHRDGKDPLTSAGACYALYAPVKDVTRPPGTWNVARLIINGSRVQHWLNGTKVVEYDMASADWKQKVAASKFKEWPTFGTFPEGHIVLQDHGDRVAYKNIKIRVLKSGAGSQGPGAGSGLTD